MYINIEKQREDDKQHETASQTQTEKELENMVPDIQTQTHAKFLTNSKSNNNNDNNRGFLERPFTTQGGSTGRLTITLTTHTHKSKACLVITIIQCSVKFFHHCQSLMSKISIFFMFFSQPLITFQYSNYNKVYFPDK